MDHSPGFLNLVNDAKKRINEISVAEARARLAADPRIVLLDVREDHEWQAEHAAGAVHLGKGILERDLEKLYPDKDTEIVMYCGGGFRSALTADAAQKLGFRNVEIRPFEEADGALASGYRYWRFPWALISAERW